MELWTSNLVLCTYTVLRSNFLFFLIESIQMQKNTVVGIQYTIYSLRPINNCQMPNVLQFQVDKMVDKKILQIYVPK